MHMLTAVWLRIYCKCVSVCVCEYNPNKLLVISVLLGPMDSCTVVVDFQKPDIEFMRFSSFPAVAVLIMRQDLPGSA